jgi:Uncharacterized protein containing LysM domain
MKKELLLSTLSALLAGTLSAENLTREQLNAMLDDLAKTPAPTKLSPGAMCYAVAPFPPRSEYTCPECDAKTIHTYENWTAYRNSVAKLRALGIDAKLDERSLCEICRAKMDGDPKAGDMFLDVTVGDTVVRNKITTHSNDLTILIAFLEGKDKWISRNNGEHAVKKSMPRIRELLGLETATADATGDATGDAIKDAAKEAPKNFASQHTVKSGDTLSSIAKQYGSTAQKIYDANKAVIGGDPNAIKIGQVFAIPEKTN